MLQNEVIDSFYSRHGGIVLIESESAGIVNLITRNSVFKNMRGLSGSAFRLQDMGKVILDNCNFT